MFRFTIRDVLWLPVLAAAFGWSGTACAVVTVELERPHDDASARLQIAKSPELTETALLLGLIETGAVTHRAKSGGSELPLGKSGKEIERRLGKPSEFQAADHALPVASADLLLPVNVKPADASTLAARARFYALEDVGGVLVFYSPSGEAHVPCAVYLRTDAEFAPLRRAEDLPKRLAWERERLEKIHRWLGIPETVKKNADGQWSVQRQEE